MATIKQYHGNDLPELRTHGKRSAKSQIGRKRSFNDDLWSLQQDEVDLSNEDEDIDSDEEIETCPSMPSSNEDSALSDSDAALTDDSSDACLTISPASTAQQRKYTYFGPRLFKVSGFDYSHPLFALDIDAHPPAVQVSDKRSADPGYKSGSPIEDNELLDIFTTTMYTDTPYSDSE